MKVEGKPGGAKERLADTPGANRPRVRRGAGDIRCLCMHNVETQFTHSGLGHKEKFVVFSYLHSGRPKRTTRRGN